MSLEKLPRYVAEILKVTDTAQDDNSVVWISKEKMEELNLIACDYVIICGIRLKETICHVVSSSKCLKRDIMMNETVRNNIQVRVNDVVRIRKISSICFAKTVVIAPIEETMANFSGPIRSYLYNYFEKDKNRPVHEGDIIKCNKDNEIQFKVIECDPKPCSVVIADTTLIIEKPIRVKYF